MATTGKPTNKYALLLLILPLVVTCCAGPDPMRAWIKGSAIRGTAQGEDGQSLPYRTRLINITLADCGPIAQWKGNVEVSARGSVKVIPDLTATWPPQFVPPSTLFLLNYQDCEISSAWLYDLVKGSVKQANLPDDLHPYFGPPSLSPSGDKMAYVIFDGADGAAYCVRSWPSLRLIRRSEIAIIGGTDVPQDRPEWISNHVVRFDSSLLRDPVALEEWQRVEIAE